VPVVLARHLFCVIGDDLGRGEWQLLGIPRLVYTVPRALTSTKTATGISLMLSTLKASARRIATVRRSLLIASGVVVVSAGAPLAADAFAQTSSPPPAPTEVSTRKPKRDELETFAKNLERRALTEKDRGRRDDLLRQRDILLARLKQGDFQAGHRILLFVPGDSAISDTFTVRSDQKLQLPNLPDISLAGVLDSELQGYLQTQLAQYIRNPTVRAQALLRVAVSGEVTSPGFYSIRTDTPVSDVVMNAGGPSTSADMNKAVLRRGNAVVVKQGGMQEAFRSELTMSDIGARPGDELHVPGKPTGSRWAKIGAAAASVTGIVWTIVYIAGR